MKKIIGYFTNEAAPKSDQFLDEVIKLSSFAEIGGDFAIDITGIKLLEDPRKWLIFDSNFAAYYSDYIDAKGNYCLHSMFPSLRTMYPGVIYRSDQLRLCTTTNPLGEFAKHKLISYIPEPLIELL